MNSLGKKSFYAVAIGRIVGIYRTWAECEPQIYKVNGAKFKSFHTEDEAIKYIEQITSKPFVNNNNNNIKSQGKNKNISNDNNNNNNSIYDNNNNNDNNMIIPREYKKIYDEFVYQPGNRRTEEEQRKAFEDFMDVLILINADTSIICYTDGACSGNPGPATWAWTAEIGSLIKMNLYSTNNLLEYGVDFSKPEDEILNLKRVNNSKYIGYGTNNIAELTAIYNLISYLLLLSEDVKIRESTKAIYIFSDSDVSVGVINGTMRASANRDLVGAIQCDLDKLNKKLKTYLRHCPGHCSVPGNEIANTLADRAYPKPTLKSQNNNNNNSEYNLKSHSRGTKRCHSQSHDKNIDKNYSKKGDDMDSDDEEEEEEEERSHKKKESSFFD